MLVQFQPANKTVSSVHPGRRYNRGINRPAFNTIIKENGWVVQIALPGTDKNDVEILVRDQQLIVKSKQVNTTENEQTTYLKREFFSNPAELYLQMPTDANTDEITAVIESGILHLSIPKRIPHTIKVK